MQILIDFFRGIIYFRYMSRKYIAITLASVYKYIMHLVKQVYMAHIGKQKGKNYGFIG
jgi:hypothetical protein